MTAGNDWMSQVNLDISPNQAVSPRVSGSYDQLFLLVVCFTPPATYC